MKKIFIFLSFFAIIFMAFVDAKDRFKALEEISANTPSQVEMNQMMNKPKTQMKPDFIPEYSNKSKQNIQNNNNFEINQNKQNQWDNVDKRRNTIQNLEK